LLVLPMLVAMLGMAVWLPLKGSIKIAWNGYRPKTEEITRETQERSACHRIDLVVGSRSVLCIVGLLTSGQGAFPALNGFEIRIGDCATHRETDDFRLVI